MSKRTLRQRKAVTFNERLLELEVGNYSDEEDWEQPCERIEPVRTSADACAVQDSALETGCEPDGAHRCAAVTNSVCQGCDCPVSMGCD